MDTIQATINQMHSRKKDDDLFIEEITNLATHEGDRVYQTLLQFLTSLDLPSSTAHDYWQQAVSHRDQMTRMLGRKVSLITALGDYLHHHREDEYTPYLIDAKSYQQIVQESVKDRLTGLNNRAYFDQVFEQQLSLAQRYNTDLSLLFLDLDNFKDINDRYGHQAGDFVLQSVAAMIQKEKRDSDIAIRYGGEEFILLMPHTGSINGLILAERIRQSIACTVLNYNNNAISITISGGLASYPTDGDISINRGNLAATKNTYIGSMVKSCSANTTKTIERNITSVHTYPC